jgi:hypothetical protein
MSFWIWVGVAIVVVLVVAFARDRRRAASRRGDKGADAERRLEGRDVKRDPHEGELWEAAAVAGDPSSVPGTATPSASRDWVVNLTSTSAGVASTRMWGEIRVLPTVRQIERQLGWYEVDGELGSLPRVVCFKFL